MDDVIMTRQRLVLVRTDTKKQPPWVVSFDPGKKGGGCILASDRTLIHMISWSRLDRKSGTVWSAAGVEAPTLAALLDQVFHPGFNQLPRLATVERSVEFTHSQKDRAHGEVLMENSGYLCCWLDMRLPSPKAIHRPRATAWRHQVLALPSETRDTLCSAAALAALSDSAVPGASHTVSWGVNASEGQRRSITEHSAEAIGQALYVQGWGVVPDPTTTNTRSQS